MIRNYLKTEKSNPGRIGVPAKGQVPVQYYFGTVLFSPGIDQSRGAKIKLPPGAGVILQLRLLSIYHKLEEILEKKITVAEEVLVNCNKFNPVA